MKYLLFTLDKIFNSMVELEVLLKEEVKQLSGPQINPISLQIISDTKSKLLATIEHYDNLRKEQEAELGIAAPYAVHTEFKLLWGQIVTQIKQSNYLNQSVYSLLDIHMQKMSNIKELVNKTGVNTSLYGSSGHSDNHTAGKVYNISI
ncbi:MAG: flagella synthesis protein FlgN [Kluyvera sp.]